MERLSNSTFYFWSIVSKLWIKVQKLLILIIFSKLCLVQYSFLLLLGLNVEALQLLQPTDGQNIVKQKLGRFEQQPSSGQILTQLKRASKSGDARAQLSLARMYHHGINTTKDIKLAFYWYSQVAEAGYASAQFDLAELYYSGIGTEKNFKQALLWYKKAAQQDLADAQYKLATLYHHGNGVELDYKRAYYWYEKAAKLSFVPAQLALAKFYETGKGVEKDWVLAQYWYEVAALYPNAEAQYYLAKLFERQEKFFQALFMYQQSAKQKFSKAQLRLAQIYYQGRWAEKNDIKALELALIVAEKGNAEAQFLVARIYHNSRQIRQNLTKARHWYKKAFDQGYKSAASFLQQLDDNIVVSKNSVIENQIAKPIFTIPNAEQIERSLVENTKTINQNIIAKPIFTIPDAEQIERSLVENAKTINQNIKELTLSAEQGNPIAQHNLSLLFSVGTLLPKDEKKAFLLMQQAAKQGLAESQNSLAIMYLKGLGIKADEQLAHFWASASAKQKNQIGRDILSYITKYQKSVQNQQ